jgi:DNA-binding CsgD family transcriptional regulator
VRIARAEGAWIEGDFDRVRAEVDFALAIALQHRNRWVAGELLLLLALAGDRRTLPDWIPRPYALYVRGDYAEAARAWGELGCPFEQALAVAGDDSEAGLRAAFDALDQLGMSGAAACMIRRLKALGVRSVPRGRRATTRANVAGLTAREVEVLDLLVDGLRNAEIGKKLFLSPKTVDHHVSSILDKLGLPDRSAAARWRRRALDGEGESAK